jgi:hypothetical protein
MTLQRWQQHVVPWQPHPAAGLNQRANMTSLQYLQLQREATGSLTSSSSSSSSSMCLALHHLLAAPLAAALQMTAAA